ncbi:hypothetical protein HY230_03300 [Candidatus Acetothermia bacterium]|nr:hypothetical protein [Candidatus Acetothermia bacterium]
MKRFLLIAFVLIILIGTGLFWLANELSPKSDAPLDASLESVNILPPQEKRSPAPLGQSTPAPSSANQTSPTINPSMKVGSIPKPDRPTIFQEQMLERGMLGVEAGAKRFAEEAYMLRQHADGSFELVSQGKIKFKFLLIDSEWRYTQAIRWESDWRPLSFALDMKGPLGFGNRQVQAQIDKSGAHIHSDGKDSERPVPDQPFFLLAFFSSFTALPQWVAKEKSDSFSLPVLGLGMRPTQEAKNRSSAPSPTTQIAFKKIGSVEIQDKKDPTKKMTVQRYDLASENFNSVLFVDGAHFIGLLSEPPDKSADKRFFVYREDLFPEGFTLAGQAR